MSSLEQMKEGGIVNIKGKDYETVALRVHKFREKHPFWTIRTEILHTDEKQVLMSAEIVDQGGRVVATGHAEETRTGNINSTSAIENCETSAVGRALAFLDLGGVSIASAYELTQADVEKERRFFIDMMKVIRENWRSINAIKDGIEIPGDLFLAKEAWRELSEEEQRVLWVAPTKGGVFTTKERDVMKSTEWGQA